MTRLNIGTGSAANDGNGDTLRTAGTKINANFVELYQRLGGDSDNLSSQISIESDGVVFEGTSTGNAFQTRLKVTDPTQDNIITLPDSTGVITLDNTIQTLTNKTLTSPTIAEIKNTGTLTLPTSTDTILGRATTDTLTNKTLSSPSINNPKIGTQISDSTGNELIKFVKTASAVNEITITNNSNTNHPSIAATGDNTDVNLSLVGKGKGSVAIGKASFTSNTITSDGQADSSSSLIICNSGSPLAVALGPGNTVGEFKLFTNKGAGLATITPAPFANGSAIRLPQNTATQCIWDGTNWFMLSGNDSANSILIT